jgi:hypothetical protein
MSYVAEISARYRANGDKTENTFVRCFVRELYSNQNLSNLLKNQLSNYLKILNPL